MTANQSVTESEVDGSSSSVRAWDPSDKILLGRLIITGRIISEYLTIYSVRCSLTISPKALVGRN